MAPLSRNRGVSATMTRRLGGPVSALGANACLLEQQRGEARQDCYRSTRSKFCSAP
jgi:hypothetical protein